MEALEEGSPVKGDGSVMGAASPRRLELQHVRRDDGGIEAEESGTPYEELVMDIPPQPEDCLLETVPGVFGIALRPEISEQPLAANPSLAP
jgi:hypothetical protein